MQGRTWWREKKMHITFWLEHYLGKHPLGRLTSRWEDDILRKADGQMWREVDGTDSGLHACELFY